MAPPAVGFAALVPSAPGFDFDDASLDFPELLLPPSIPCAFDFAPPLGFAALSLAGFAGVLFPPRIPCVGSTG